MVLPLEKLYITITRSGGTEHSIPALDIHWTSSKIFTEYLPLLKSDGQLKTGDEFLEWEFIAKAVKRDMEFLLKLSHHEFWSYLKYQMAASTAIATFLQNAIPFYARSLTTKANTQAYILHDKLLELVVRIIKRILTSKESEKEWISKDYHKDLLYRNLLVTVPMLLDLVIAIGNTNRQSQLLLQDILKAARDINTDSNQDYLALLCYYTEAFLSIEVQVKFEGAAATSSQTTNQTTENNNNTTPYDDVVFFMLDCAYTLSLLLELMPEFIIPLCEEITLGTSIMEFYNSTIPSLSKGISKIHREAPALKLLNVARQQFLKSFHMIAFSYIEKSLNGMPNEVEKFIEFITDALSSPAFAMDYQRCYPVESDFDVLKIAAIELDTTTVSYILDGLKGIAQERRDSKKTKKCKKFESLFNASKPKPKVTNKKNTKKLFVEKKKPDAIEAQKPINQENIDLKVERIFDIFPELGTGYIRKIALRYETSEEAVAAILECNLPPDLAEADRNEIYIPEEPQPGSSQQLDSKRSNVFDGDQYDIMTQDNPKCIIKKGKGLPGKPKSAEEMLEDKSHVNDLRGRYQEWGLVAEYDDEYDDSYDAFMESERKLRTNFGDDDLLSSESEDESEENKPDEASSGRNNRDNFCENPEDARARYAAFRLRAPKFGSSKASNVAGAPKGQGQSKETQRSRGKKETNKAYHGNHNRKAGAAYKRRV